MSRTNLAILLFALSAFTSSSFANEGIILERFHKRSLNEIKQERKNQPFLVVFWSKDCGYCVKEMDMLADLKPDNPDLEIVLISTDTDLDSQTAQAVLDQTGLSVDRIWVFEQEFSKRMYASVDETWSGELPNTLFLNSQHEFQSVKGEVNEDMVLGWLEYIREEQPRTSPQNTPAKKAPSTIQRVSDWADSINLF